MCSFDFSKNYTPVDLLKNGYIDAMKLFIKLEPHKISKLNENRERLIFSVSLIDNIIAILLCNAQNKTEIINYLTIPSKAGLSFTDEGTRKFLETIPDFSILGTDVKDWDFHLKPWEFQLDLDRRADLNGGHNTLWYHLLQVQYYCIQRKVFVLSDGTMYAQVLPGIMPSGYNNTTSTNSAIRAGNHHVIAAKLQFNPWCYTMGDDSLEKDHPGVTEAYTSYLGKTIKDSKIVSKDSGFEFCSNFYKDGISYSTSCDKQLFNLLNFTRPSQTEIDERYLQFKYELRHHPKLNSLLSIIALSGWLQQVNGYTLGGWSNDTKTVISVLNQMPRDCTVSSFEWSAMYSPVCHAVSNIMTKTKAQKRKAAINLAALTNNLAKTKITPKKKKAQKQNNNYRPSGPMANAGGALGSSIGNYFGLGGIGSSVGRWLGSGIGMITGTGDYTMIGPKPQYNILSGQIPKFSSTYQTNIVCHREYLGDLTGTTAFNNLQYPLNPGLASTFPWLSQIAPNYQQYRFHGIMFEFRPLITDFVTSGAPGVVVMATNYNADQTAYISKQEMENSEFAVSVKPTNPLMHMVECDPAETAMKLYNIRTGPVGSNQDLRLYDLGLFQFATQANPIQTLGELWVSYCVEFFKPVLALENSVAQADAVHLVRTNVSTANPLGTTTLIQSGSLSITIASSTKLIINNATVGINYYISTFFASSNNATNSVVVPTFTGATTLSWNALAGVADASIAISTTGTVSTQSDMTCFFTATSPSVTLTFPTSGVYATAPNSLELFITSVDPVVIN